MHDGPTDKYIHLSPVDPEPNGVTRLFAVPDQHLVTGTVLVVLDDEEVELEEYDPDASPAQEEYVMLESGRVQLSAPDTGQILKVSYFFQWFTDDDLIVFLGQGLALLGYEDAEDTGISVPLRAPILSFAAHYAYLKMAAQAAQALQAGAAGYTADNTAEHPNWMRLAEMAWESAARELEVVANNPTTTARPALAFVNFAMSRYTPRS